MNMPSPAEGLRTDRLAAMNRIKQTPEEEVVPDEFRCKRSDGKQWRCIARAMENKALCEKHYNQAKKRGTNPCSSSSSSVPAVAAPNTSPKKMRVSEAKSKPKIKGGHVSSSSSSSPANFASSELKSFKDLSFCEHAKLSKRTEDAFKVTKSPSSTSSAKPQQFGDADKVKCLHYLLSFVHPLLEQAHQEQCQEMDIETKWHGVQIERLKLMKIERLYCDNCSTSVIDLFRSCLSCSYNLCLTCCHELRHGRQPGGEKASSAKKLSYTRVRVFSNTPESENQYKLPDWSVNENDSIPCPHPERGGCGSGVLFLKRILKPDWIAKMVNDVNVIMKLDSKSHLFPDAQGPGCDCSNRFTSDPTVISDHYNACIRQAANRTGGKDNFLYCPTLQLSKKEGLQHFQKHWLQGEPVIVRNVLKSTSSLSWDPLDICHAVRESINDTSEGEAKIVQALDCLNWSQVDINIHQFFKGYQEGRTHKDGWPEMLQLKDWPPSELFEGRLARHSAEFISGLPFHEYTHPKYGNLNLMSKLPEYILKPDLGPKACIAYGMREELGCGDSVIKLHSNLFDVVNVLVHATAVKLSEGQKRQLEKVLERYREENTSSDKDWHENVKSVPLHHAVFQEKEICGGTDSEYDADKIALSRKHEHSRNDFNVTNVGITEEYLLPEKEAASSLIHETKTDCEGRDYEQSSRSMDDSNGGAIWDVFRRKDLPKLHEYLQKYYHESQQVSQQPLPSVAHPIHGQNIYITKEHKRRLRDKYGVDPWTFEQRIGEAVLIPAGCAYQVRNLMSCTHIEMDFVSPESLRECIRLSEEVRLLPEHHHAKEDKLEVKKMMLFAANKALKDLDHLVSPGSDHLSGLTGAKHSDRLGLKLSQQRREYVLG